MKYLFLVLMLSGCSVFQQPVIQTKLVYVEPPIEITIKPEKIKSLDPEKATEKDFSNWVIESRRVSRCTAARLSARRNAAAIRDSRPSSCMRGWLRCANPSPQNRHSPFE